MTTVKGLSISDVVDRTGISEGTLRMWERRHGFPVPERLPSGHRRYSEEQLELVRAVVAARSSGLSLGAAIDRVRTHSHPAVTSLFATLRRRHPELEAHTISRPLLIALSYSIEDECLSRAERPVLFGSFQRPSYWRGAAKRWRELSHGSPETTFVFATFEKPSLPAHGVREIPVDPDLPFAREWTIVCDADRFGVVMCGREVVASSLEMPDAERRFEFLWSVEPGIVREAARICAGFVEASAPDELDAVRHRLETEPAATSADQLRLATAVTTRLLTLVEEWRDT